MATKVKQFVSDTWDEIEAWIKPAKLEHTKGWYNFTPKGGEQVRFLYGDYIINRDGVWSASKDKPRGV